MEQLAQTWLSTLCRQISGASRGAVFLASAEGELAAPAVLWPADGSANPEFTEQVKEVLFRRETVVLSNGDWHGAVGEPRDLVATPLEIKKKLCGVAVIEFASRTSAPLQAAVEKIENGTTWFETLAGLYASGSNKQLISVVEFVASCLEYDRFDEAATAVATDFATKLSCDRVAIGFVDGGGVKVEALSHHAGFDKKSNLVKDIGEAMFEAIDQETTVAYPSPEGVVHLTRCHDILVRQHEFGSVLTIPFVCNKRVSGAFLIEHLVDESLSQEKTAYYEQLASLVGPILEVRRRDEQWFRQKLYEGGKQPFVKLFGPRQLGFKLGVIAALALFIFMGLVTADYKVASDARLEAKIQRVVVAPQKGYVAQANVRPGDVIQAGEVLGTLDDKDLKLQYHKLSSQKEQLEKEYRGAMASHNRSETSIIQARILQIRAQLALIREQLARLRLTAPFNGVIVSGDLSQALGSPVERGQVLFTVAPLEEYRIVLQVDERDIGVVREGQRGHLLLSGMVDEPLPFMVEKITPVSIPEKGRNYFQVEAKVEKQSDLLRPGMEGVAKIEVGRRKLLWIWGHSLADWLRLKVWGLVP